MIDEKDSTKIAREVSKIPTVNRKMKRKFKASDKQRIFHLEKEVAMLKAQLGDILSGLEIMYDNYNKAVEAKREKKEEGKIVTL